MFDIALSRAGATIAMTTSLDKNYPPENMLDGQTDSFWVTTGLFPQECIISFPSMMEIKSVQIACCNVGKLELYKTSRNDIEDFEKIAEKELDQTEGRLQTEEFPLSRVSATHLKFVICSSHDHFAAVYRVSVDGSAAS